jgi:hypothetical protein
MKKLLLILMAIIAFNLQIITAQEAAMKIASGNPDLKVQVKRCVANGDQVFIDLTFMDEAEDVEATILCQGWTEIQDSDGNTYNGYPNLFCKIAKGEYTPYPPSFTLLEGTPIKVFFKLEKVPSSTEFIARMKIRMESKKYGIPNYVTIKNIPITRD